MGDVIYTYNKNGLFYQEDEVTKKLVDIIKLYGTIRDEDAWIKFVDIWGDSDTKSAKKEVDGWDTWEEWKAFLIKERKVEELKKRYNSVIEYLRIKEIIIDKEPSYEIADNRWNNRRKSIPTEYDAILQAMDKIGIAKHFNLLTETQQYSPVRSMKAIEFNKYINMLLKHGYVKMYL